MGRMRQSAFRARWRTASIVAAVSMAGRVLGIAQMVVKPPRAAARAPDAMVSLCSCPGSRRWTWRSTNPGATTSPVASITSAVGLESAAPTSAMRPSTTRRSRRASVRDAGSIRRPPRTISCRSAVMRCLESGGRGWPCVRRVRRRPGPRYDSVGCGRRRRRFRCLRSWDRDASRWREVRRGPCARP